MRGCVVWGIRACISESDRPGLHPRTTLRWMRDPGNNALGAPAFPHPPIPRKHTAQGLARLVLSRGSCLCYSWIGSHTTSSVPVPRLPVLLRLHLQEVCPGRWSLRACAGADAAAKTQARLGKRRPGRRESSGSFPGPEAVSREHLLCLKRGVPSGNVLKGSGFLSWVSPALPCDEQRPGLGLCAAEPPPGSAN